MKGEGGIRSIYNHTPLSSLCLTAAQQCMTLFPRSLSAHECRVGALAAAATASAPYSIC